MSHGGAREGAGRKNKYVDNEGNPLPTKRASIPEIVTEEDIQKIVYEKTKDSNKQN